MADWCALPGSAVVLIARSLQLIEDFIAFRATCSSWLKATTWNDFYTSSSCPILPFLMLEHFEERTMTYFDDQESFLLELRLESLRHVQSEGPEANHQMDENDPDENNEIVQSEDLDDDEGSIDLKLELSSHVQSKDPEANHDEMDEKDPEANQEMNEMVERKDLDDQHKFVRLIEREGPEANHERKFFSLSKEKTCNISFPEANGMEYRGSKGWLVMVESSTGNMCLFHPISRVYIPLPKVPFQTNSEGFMIEPKNFKSAVLSARPSETSDYVVMVVFMEESCTSVPEQHYVLWTYTWFWKPGNLTWTQVDIPCWVEDLNYYNGKFYALTNHAQVWMCEASVPTPKASKIVELPWKNWSRPDAQLVECEGRLLIVAPYFRYHYDMESLDDLQMVEIDVIKGSYNTITGLGTSAVFLGCNQGFSVDANRFPGIIMPNSIYFSDGSYQVATPGPNHKSEPNSGHGIWVNF